VALSGSERTVGTVSRFKASQFLARVMFEPIER
jgi:hypothetical protein